MTIAETNISDLLRSVQFLDELSPGDLAKIAEIAAIENLAKSTVLFQEGTACESLYVVADGMIGLDMCMPRRGCMRMLTVGPGEIVGWSALLADARMTARAVVVEDVILIAFPARQLQELCDADHDIGYVVMKQVAMAMSRRLLATRLQQLDLFIETSS
ncbi:MAG: Crp/Fnr family transcriptional regulator [Planctomycetaceae bacterium]